MREKYYKSINNNKSSLEIQKSNYIMKDYNSIKKNNNELIIKDYNDFKNNNSKFNNYFDNDFNKKDFKLFKQKINLKNLKLGINKFENSKKYYANIDTIYKNMKIKNKFINKKFIKNNRLDRTIINKKEFNNSIKSYIKKRNIHSAPKKFETLDKIKINSIKNNSNANRTINIMNKYNRSILIQNINDIQQKIKIKKKILKKEKKKKHSYIKKIMNYFKNQAYNDKDIDKALKKDFIEYQNKIGRFVKVDENYLYSNHISLIIDKGNKIKY